MDSGGVPIEYDKTGVKTMTINTMVINTIRINISIIINKNKYKRP